jgi:hypothetical protein
MPWQWLQKLDWCIAGWLPHVLWLASVQQGQGSGLLGGMGEARRQEGMGRLAQRAAPAPRTGCGAPASAAASTARCSSARPCRQRAAAASCDCSGACCTRRTPQAAAARGSRRRRCRSRHQAAGWWPAAPEPQQPRLRPEQLAECWRCRCCRCCTRPAHHAHLGSRLLLLTSCTRGASACSPLLDAAPLPEQTLPRAGCAASCC